MTHFYGKAIAIDISGWRYANFSSALKRVVNTTDVAVHDPDRALINRNLHLLFLEFMLKLLAYGITPVIIFDGKPPELKTRTLAMRKKDKEDIGEEIRTMKAHVRQMDLLERDAKVITELRKLLCKDLRMYEDERDLFRQIVKSTGLPCFESTEEAEKLCSMLSREGLVSAVYSDDTDNYVHGAECIITGYGQPIYDNDRRIDTFEMVYTKDVLQSLQLDRERFRDLCIMAGCDYNTTMKKVRIKTAYKLINQYGGIDHLPNNYDAKCLNHEECRKIFTPVSAQSLIQTPKDMEQKETIDLSMQKPDTHFLSRHGYVDQANRLALMAQHLPTPSVKLVRKTNESPSNPPSVESRTKPKIRIQEAP